MEAATKRWGLAVGAAAVAAAAAAGATLLPISTPLASVDAGEYCVAQAGAGTGEERPSAGIEKVRAHARGIGGLYEVKHDACDLHTFSALPSFTAAFRDRTTSPWRVTASWAAWNSFSSTDTSIMVGTNCAMQGAGHPADAGCARWTRRQVCLLLHSSCFLVY